MNHFILKPDKKNIIKNVFVMSFALSVILSIFFLFSGGTIRELIDSRIPLIMFIGGFIITSLRAIFLLCRTEIEITSKGLYKKGWNKYGYQELIPWVKVKKVSIWNYKGSTFLRLLISYQRNYLSNNGSKAIDTENVDFNVGSCGFSDDEILSMVNKFKK